MCNTGNRVSNAGGISTHGKSASLPNSGSGEGGQQQPSRNKKRGAGTVLLATAVPFSILLFCSVFINMGAKSSSQMGAFFYPMIANCVHPG